MQLEVISRRPKGAAQATPLLFVHGAYGGAWIWEEHFLPYFAERGYAAYALSLRGHGRSEGRERLAFARLGDYVADVERVMADLDRPPVLIGHSMGGMVVQKVLHRRRLPAAVLMASAPPHGMVPSLFGMIWTDPGLFWDLAMMEAAGADGTASPSVRRALFSPGVPDAEVDRYMRRFRAESIAVILDLMGLDLPPSTPCLDIPVLVLGAEDDHFVFPGAVAETARTYRTEGEIFQGMAHAMMVDRRWRDVAERIAEWLSTALAARGHRRPSAVQSA
ncbi:MAG: alpha/beta fold hydrolase [Rhodospirillales bacterium]